MHIHTVARDVHKNARDKGFHDGIGTVTTFLNDDEAEERAELFNLSEKLALIHEEISEALKVLRENGYPVADTTEGDMFLEELADAVIRIFDLAELVAPGEIEEAILVKMTKNAGRPHMHGRRF